MKPSIAPDVAAALLAAVPARLIKKLDADPDQATRWTWADDGLTATTPTGERVALHGATITAAADVTCSCLLAPRCLHVAAVVALLAPAEAVEPAAAAAVAAAPAPAHAPAADTVALDADQRDAIALAWRAAAALIATGADATGTAAQAGVLRAIHACRAAGLHRAATAATRVLAQLRELRADRAEFELGQLATDLRDLLATLHALSTAPTATAALIGTARRRYEPIGGLRLHGVFTDAVAARSGYAGVVTYLTDGARLFTVSDVAPGDAARAVAAYDAGADIGDATLAHRDLGRAGLFLAAATASRDGRLGAGKDVRAARAAASSWDDPPIAALWAPPLAAQLARLAAPADDRPAGSDLVFVTGEVVAGPALRLDDGTVLALAAATDRGELRHRDNLIALAARRGARVRVVARARLDRPRVIAPLAIGSASAGADADADPSAAAVGAASLPLPDALAGRVNLAFDRLGSAATSPHALAAPAAPDVPDPLLALRRRVERIALAGAATLPPEAAAELARERARFTRLLFPGAAAALAALAAAAHTGGRRADGRRASIDADRFARAWLRSAVYLDAASRHLAAARWTAT
jgi:hypothetical protein